jgi:hypothetical protein
MTIFRRLRSGANLQAAFFVRPRKEATEQADWLRVFEVPVPLFR